MTSLVPEFGVVSEREDRLDLNFIIVSLFLSPILFTETFQRGEEMLKSKCEQ